MKIIALPLLFIPFNIFAQADKWNPNKLDDKLLKLEAQYVAPASITLPFAAIKIIDSRFDTSKIGFIYSNKFFGSRTDNYKKIKLQKGVATAVEDYYNEYYQKSFTNNGFELLIVIKKLWFSHFDAGKSKIQDLANGSENKRGSFVCKWEYYINNKGNYVPVRRVDTTFQFSEELGNNIKTDFEERKLGDFKFFLKALVEQYNFETVITGFANANKKTIQQINEYNNKRFNIPIIQDSFIRKGVYLNIDEFKANKPSIIIFTEKKMKYGGTKKEEYIEDEKGNNINPFWGYSDGKWIKYGLYDHDYIFRVNNAFEYFAKETSFYINRSLEYSPITHTSKTESYIPVQIDMETGEVY